MPRTVTVDLPQSKFPPATADARAEDDLEYDLVNLCAHDPHPLDPAVAAECARAARQVNTRARTLAASGNPRGPRTSSSSSDSSSGSGAPAEPLLAAQTRDALQLLANRVFSLPTSACDTGGLLAELPSAQDPPPGTAVIPRAHPAPAGKAETRWERFAREKGIVAKTKRSKLVHDDATGRWLPRHGAQSLRNEEKRGTWAVELKPGEAWPKEGEDPFDPAQRKRKEAERKQRAREERNRDEAAAVAMAQRHGKRGVNDGLARSVVKRGAQRALGVAQVSTASAGKFDRRVEGEGSTPRGRVKRARDSVREVAGSSSREKDRNMGVLGKLFSGDELVNADKAARVHMASSQSAVAKQRSEAGLPSNRKKGGSGKAGVRKTTKNSGNKRNRSK